MRQKNICFDTLFSKFSDKVITLHDVRHRLDRLKNHRLLLGANEMERMRSICCPAVIRMLCCGAGRFRFGEFVYAFESNRDYSIVTFGKFQSFVTFTNCQIQISVHCNEVKCFIRERL